MEPTAADVMPKVIIKESLSATGGTAKEQAAREAGKKIVDKAKEGAWREALDATNRKKPIEQKNIDRKLDEIGVERNAAGKKTRSTEEEARFNRAKGAADLAKKTIEQGYDKLNPTDQIKLRTAIEDKIKSNPLLTTEFNSLNATQQKNEIERRLRDPKFLADLSEEVANNLNPETKLIEEQKIVERKEDVKEKELKKTEAENAVTDLTNQIKDLDKSLKEFERSPAGVKGAKAVELDTLQAQLPTLQEEAQDWRDKLDDADTELRGLKEEINMLKYREGGRNITSINAEIATKTANIRNAKEEIDKREKSIHKISALQAEEATLKEEKLKAENSKKEKDTDFKKADWELSKAQRRLDDLKREREYEEEDLASNMENVFSKTANKYIGDEFEAMKTRVDDELVEAKKNTSNADEQAILKASEKRWEKIDTTWKGQIKRTVSRKKTERDWVDLTGTGSPDNIIREMLRTQVNTRTGVNYTDADINVLLADKADSGFYKKMAPEVITQVLRRKILAGGITKADVFNIQNSQWGEGMIMKAIEKNKANAAALEALIGEKAVNPGFGKKLWEQVKKKPWLLALLVGIIALPVMAAKEGTSSVVS